MDNTIRIKKLKRSKKALCTCRPVALWDFNNKSGTIVESEKYLGFYDFGTTHNVETLLNTYAGLVLYFAEYQDLLRFKDRYGDSFDFDAILVDSETVHLAHDFNKRH